jgi:HYR domain/Bacterial Ig domain
MKLTIPRSTLHDSRSLFIGFVLLLATALLLLPGAATSSDSAASVEMNSTGSLTPPAPALPRLIMSRRLLKTGLPAPLFAPTVTATKSAAFDTPGGDVNGNGLFDPGDTIRYSVVVSASGMDATNINFSDTLDTNITFVNGSLAASPVAVDDAYPQTLVGNVSIDSSLIPYSVVSNDFLGVNPTATIAAYDSTSAHGGTVSMTMSGAGIGQFTYNPPAGYEGTDTFTYTLSDQPGNPSTLTNRKATVTLTISGMVWFVNNTAGAGDGRLSSPFNSLAAFQSVNDGASNHPAANDNVFLYESSTAYTGPVTLLSGQKLIGQDATVSLSTITGLTPPSSSPSFPTMNSGNATIVKITSSSNAINLTNGSTGNLLRGLTVGSTTGIGINGTSFGTMTVADAAMADSPNRTGQALSLSTGTLAATFASMESKNSAATGISLTGVGGSLTSSTTTVTNPSGIGISVNTSSAALSFGTTSSTGSGSTGVSLTSNSGTITFSSLTITPDVNQRGLLAQENSGTITTTSGTISVSSQPAVEITRSSGTTPLVVSLTSISANGGANGIKLSNTSGSFSITGGGNTSVGGDNSGGTIQNTTGHGIFLTNAQNLSFTNINVTNIATSGIFGTTVTNFTLTNSKIDGVNTSHTGADSDIAFNTGVNATENNVSGTVSMTKNIINNSYQAGIDIQNYSGTISNLTITNNSFTSSTSNTLSLGTAINVVANRSASNHATITAASISANTITNFPSGAGIQVIAGNSNAGQTVTLGSSGSPFLLQDNTINGSGPGSAGIGTNGIAVTAGESTTAYFTIGQSGHPNTITNVRGDGIAVSLFGNGSMKATVGFNVINANNTAGSSGINTGADQSVASGSGGSGTLDLDIHNNNITNTTGNGILATVSSVSSTGIYWIQNNNVAAPTTSSGTIYGIRVSSGNGVGNPTVCLKVSGNTTAGSTNGSVTAPGIGLRQSHSDPGGGVGTFNIEGLSPNPSNDAQMEAYVGNAGQNPGSANGTFGTTGVAAISSGGTYHAGTCTFTLSVPNEVMGASTGTVSDQGNEMDDQALTLRAPHGQAPKDDSVRKLSQAELNWMAQAAIERWRQAGISTEDLARLQALTFELADLPEGQLSSINGTQVKVDETAAGYGWFVDQTPQEDGEFLVPVPGRELQTTEYSPAHGKMDLLTVLMRELGTVYLQGNRRVPKALRPLMEPTLSPGVRRLPDARPITFNLSSLVNNDKPQPRARAGSFASANMTVAYRTATANASGLRYAMRHRPAATAALAPMADMVSQAIGTLPATKSVTVTFKATINNPFPNGVCAVTNTAQVSGSNFTSPVNSNSTTTNVAIPPAFSSCPSNSSVNTDPNLCTASVSFTPTATGCPAPTITCKIGATTITSPFAFPKGVSSVTCTAHNTSGPDAACSFTVTVTDNQAPTITCPAPITQNTDPGLCTAVVSYATPTGSDNCPLGPGAVVCAPSSGSVFPKGATTVTCTVTDAANLSASCSFTVTVKDATAPVVTCAPAGGAFVPNDCYPSLRMAFTGTSFYSNNTVNVVMTNPQLYGFSSCTGLPNAGSQAINFNATFAADVSVNGGPITRMQAPATVALNATFVNQVGNTKNYTTQMTQLDVGGGIFPAGWQLRESPTLSSNGQIAVTTITGGDHLDSFFDVFTELSTNGGSTWNPGTASGHLAAVQSTDSNLCTAVINYAAASATDNCGTVTPSCMPASGTAFQKGVTTVTCTASDTATPPNTSSCSFTVTVVDAQAPTLSCPANISLTSSGGCQTATYTTPSASDNCTGATVSCSPASGTCFTVGTTTVTCTATDTSANQGQCSFTVTVTPCTISCPANQSANAAAGNCAATVSYPAPTTTGNCGTVSCMPPSGSSFAVGVTTVSCTTQSGPSCTFTVTVTDTQPPQITCPTPVTQSTDPNLCSAIVTYTTPTGSDNCTLPANAVVCTPASGTSFPKGVTTVSCTVSDAANLTASCTFTITVNDTQPPTITCPASLTQSTDPNVCTAVVTYATPSVNDNCPGVGTPTCSPASGSTFQKGVTTVSCSVTDASSNSQSCSFTVTVNDTQAPTITCPAPITQNTDSNLCSAVVTYSQPAITDNCPCSSDLTKAVKGTPLGTPSCTVSCTPASGTAFPKGTTTVSCTGTDTSGNTAQCSFTITVIDNQNPSVGCPANITQSTDPNVCTAVVTYTTPAGSDNCPLGPNPVVCAPASGTTFQKGISTVTCTVTDASGHTGQCSFTVTVNDTQKPSITCPGNVTVSNSSGQCTAVATFSLPSVTDNCAGVGTPTCSPASGSTFQAGLTTVTCTVSDASGNSQSCSFTVTVNDTQNPQITCPSPITHSTDPNLCSAVVTYPAPSVTDNCAGVGTPTCSPASGTVFPKGTTTVHCTVKDASNNMVSCTFTVTVNDTQNPSVGCPANITFTTPGNSDPCGVVTYTTPAGSDNCGIQSVGCSPSSGACFPVGMTTVTCTATDTSGNKGACSFKVTVQNPCAITCPANITKANDANQCGAVTTFAPSITGGGCGVVICTPASGSFFPKGTTTVSCATQAGPNCSFTVTVNDTQPPSFPNGCLAISVVAPLSCPTSASSPASYTKPAAIDNCPGVSVACVPPPGSVFGVGTTSVTCTATDSSGNTASCSFPLTVWTACLQDESNPRNVVLFNAQTGEYQFCCGGVVVATGMATLTVRGCVVQFDHIKGNRKINIRADMSVKRGTATLIIANQTTCVITDQNMANNNCQCPASISVSKP